MKTEKIYKFIIKTNNVYDFLMDTNISFLCPDNKLVYGFCKESNMRQIENKFSKYNIIFTEAN